MALWLFVFCGQLLVIYNRKIAQNLLDNILPRQKVISKENNKEIAAVWSILSEFKLLCDVRCRLFYDYRFILMGNVLLNVNFILSCSYYFIEFLDTGWVGIFWEVAGFIEFTFRLWLICHTADRIRSSVRIHKNYRALNLFKISLIKWRQLNAFLFYVKWERK